MELKRKKGVGEGWWQEQEIAKGTRKLYAGSGPRQGPFLESNLFPPKVGLRWVFFSMG